MHSNPQFPGKERVLEGVRDRVVFPAARTQLTAHIARAGSGACLPCALEERDMRGEREARVCPSAAPAPAPGEVTDTWGPGIRGSAVWVSRTLALASPHWSQEAWTLTAEEKQFC